MAYSPSRPGGGKNDVPPPPNGQLTENPLSADQSRPAGSIYAGPAAFTRMGVKEAGGSRETVALPVCEGKATLAAMTLTVCGVAVARAV